MGAKAKMAGRLIKGAFGLGVDAAKPVAKVAGKAIGVGMDGVGLGVEVAGAGIRGASKAIGLGEKPVGKLADAAGSALSPEKLVKYDKDGWVSGLSGRGKLIVGGLIGVNMATTGYGEYEKEHLGKIDGQIHTATPDYSQYVKMKTPKTTYSPAPAAADGSLVFALDRTKNGGFL